jgi:hypothetical protein
LTLWYVRRLRTANLSQKLAIPLDVLLGLPALVVDKLLVISDEHEAAIDDAREEALKNV